VDQWRKLYFQSGFKASVAEVADILGVTRRSLEMDIQNVKMGEKYAFPFEENMGERISELKRFLKEKSQAKKMQER
jgi:chromosome condensin MukBEF complex kleisin-like MukF subunit